MARIAATLVAASLTVAVVSAENWPAWRGPDGAGVSPGKNLPTAWSDSSNIAWQVPLRGLGVSTPITWGNRIFVTSQEGAVVERAGDHPTLIQGAELAGSGERTLGGRKQGDRTKADEDVRFIVIALDRDSGRRLWEYTLKAEGELPEVHEKHNLASPSPVSDGERVYAWFCDFAPPTHWPSSATMSSPSC